MVEKQEKLSELAADLKRLRVLKNEKGNLYIRENALDAYDNLSDNIQFIKDNFEYFAKTPSSVMYPDEFILAIKFLPEGNEILANNLEYILKTIKHRAERVRPQLIGIPEISEKTANNFETIFNLMVNDGIEKDISTDVIDDSARHIAHCLGDTQKKLSVFMKIIQASENVDEVLEENKKMFLNTNFNSAMADMVKILAENPKCHNFIRDNFDTIRKECFVSDLAKLYYNIREICPEEFEKQAFIIDNIYIPAKEKNTEGVENIRVDQICSRIIDQERTEDIKTLTDFLIKNAEIDVNTFKYLGSGWFNLAIQAGDKVVKLALGDEGTEKPKIPYHPRLLQPIVRKNDISKDPKYPLGIEISEIVDMDTEISDEEILEIYIELREDGIKWTDINKDGNLGRLRKDNYPYELGQNVPLPPKLLGIEESGIQRKILKAGQLVIIDLDCLEMAENQKGSDFTKMSVIPECVREYEAEYQKRISDKKIEKQDMLPEGH